MQLRVGSVIQCLTSREQFSRLGLSRVQAGLPFRVLPALPFAWRLFPLLQVFLLQLFLWRGVLDRPFRERVFLVQVCAEELFFPRLLRQQRPFPWRDAGLLLFGVLSVVALRVQLPDALVRPFDEQFVLSLLLLVLPLAPWQFFLALRVHAEFFLVRSFGAGFSASLLAGELCVAVLPSASQFCQLLPFHAQFCLVQLFAWQVFLPLPFA